MYGTWRSQVAHFNGVEGVVSSNLAVPTDTNMLQTILSLEMHPQRIWEFDVQISEG